MNNKRWCVKGFVWDNVDKSKYIKANDKEKKTKNPARIEKKIVYHVRRRMTILRNNLTWQAAKVVCKQNHQFQAMIFPAVKEEELKVTILK